MSRQRRCSGADGKPITARGWFDFGFDGARRLLCLYRPRTRQPGAAFRFQQGLYPRARRSGAVAAGGEEASLQQGAGGAGEGAQGPAAGGHADRDLRARPRCQRQPDRVPGRRPTPGQFSVRRTENFDVSDAVLLPSGDLLVLERKFSLFDGVGIRIRRIALDIDGAGRRGRRPLRSSTPIWATRSTTWKVSTPMSRRRATPC